MRLAPRLLAVILFVSICSRGFGAMNFGITKIADTSTPIPNGAGNFTSFGVPSLAAGNPFPGGISYSASFLGAGTGNLSGVYRVAGMGSDGATQTLTRTADTTMPIASPLTGNYVSFGQFWGGPAASRVTFPAISSVNPNEKGIFGSTSGGTPTLLVSSGNVGGHAVSTISDVSGNNTDVAFRADGAIYCNNNVLVANNTIRMPGGAVTDLFATTGVPHLDGTTDRSITFRGASGASGLKGVYIHRTDILGGSAISKVADTNTPVPGKAFNFTDFGDIVGNDFTGYFRGISAGQQGIYRKSGTITTSVDTNMVAPDAGGATYAAFGEPAKTSTSSSSLAFTANLSDGRQGIYAGENPAIRKVIDTFDELDGKSVASFSISSVAFNTRVFVFKADFTDGSQGLYWADLVPEPSSILFLAALPLACRPRRRVPCELAISRE